MKQIFIAGLDKAEVLMALFNATPLGQAVALTREDAVTDLNNPSCFEWINLHVEPIDVTAYDAENGEGAAERALAPLFRKLRGEPEPVLVVDDTPPVNVASLLDTAIVYDTSPIETPAEDAEPFEGGGGASGGAGASGSFDTSDSGSSSSSSSDSSSSSSSDSGSSSSSGGGGE